MKPVVQIDGMDLDWSICLNFMIGSEYCKFQGIYVHYYSRCFYARNHKTGCHYKLVITKEQSEVLKVMQKHVKELEKAASADSVAMTKTKSKYEDDPRVVLMELMIHMGGLSDSHIPSVKYVQAQREFIFKIRKLHDAIRKK